MRGNVKDTCEECGKHIERVYFFHPDGGNARYFCSQECHQKGKERYEVLLGRVAVTRRTFSQE